MSFIAVDVDPGPAHEDGVSLRFKRSPGGEARRVLWVTYESEEGLGGRWAVFTADHPEGPPRPGALAAEVDDSSDGSAWLVHGGRQGLVLVHDETGTTERAPYLVLARATPLG